MAKEIWLLNFVYHCCLDPGSKTEKAAKCTTGKFGFVLDCVMVSMLNIWSVMSWLFFRMSKFWKKKMSKFLGDTC